MPKSNTIHPKVKAAGTVATVLLAVDAAIVAIEGSIPSPGVVSAMALAHSILPIVAGYLKP